MEWRNIRKHRVPKTEEPINAPAGPVIASAALVNVSSLRRRFTGKSEKWQEQAWDLYDEVSELRFGVGWLANAVSRARLFIGRIDPDGSDDPQPVEDDEQLIAPLEELAGGQVGQSQMLHRMIVHLSVPGETYLIGWDDPESEDRRWIVASRDEFSVSQAGTLRIRLPESDVQVTVDADKSVVIRIWRPHPRRAWNADSPMRALRSPLRELVGLSSHIAATVDSRLAGAGVLVLPDSATLPQPRESDGTPNPLHPDPFVSALIEAMVTPLQDRDSAGAVVPLVIRVPETAVGGVKHLAFSTPLDAKVLESRQAAIRRVATGLDVPAEVLEGLGESNHWSAWAIDESAVKLHIRPLLALVCSALTEQYLRPALKSAKVNNPEDYALWFDTHSLTLRPNRGPESITLWDKGLVSDDTVRRENGFADTDAPSNAERRRNTALQLALSQATIAPYMIPLLDLGVTIPDPAETTAQAGEPVEDSDEEAPEVESGQGRPELPASRPTNQTQPPAGRPVPQQQRRRAVTASVETWRGHALEIASLRALERAGNWLLHRAGRGARGQLTEVPLHEMHTHLTASPDDLDAMLAGAYRELQATLPAEPCLREAVDYYVRSLLVAGEAHQRRHLEAALVQSGCPDAAA